MRGKTNGRYRGPREDESERQGAWLTTYADAVTLLLAFFVLLYAWSDVDRIRFTAFVEGLRGPFGNVSVEEGLLTDRDGLLVDNDHLKPHEMPDLDALLDMLTRIENPRLLAILEQLPTTAIAELEARAQAEAQLAEVEAALDAALAEAGLSDAVTRHRDERGLVVSISADSVLFALGSTDISPVGSDIVELLSATLLRFDNPLLVEGHTDDIPVRRADYTNWNLSTDRAVAVLEQMVEQHGLPAARVAAAGYGEHHPVGDNSTADGRASNRRVDIVVLLGNGSGRHPSTERP